MSKFEVMGESEMSESEKAAAIPVTSRLTASQLLQMNGNVGQTNDQVTQVLHSIDMTDDIARFHFNIDIIAKINDRYIFGAITRINGIVRVVAHDRYSLTLEKGRRFMWSEINSEVVTIMSRTVLGF